METPSIKYFRGGGNKLIITQHRDITMFKADFMVNPVFNRQKASPFIEQMPQIEIDRIQRDESFAGFKLIGDMILLESKRLNSGRVIHVLMEDERSIGADYFKNFLDAIEISISKSLLLADLVLSLNGQVQGSIAFPVYSTEACQRRLCHYLASREQNQDFEGTVFSSMPPLKDMEHKKRPGSMLDHLIRSKAPVLDFERIMIDPIFANIGSLNHINKIYLVSLDESELFNIAGRIVELSKL